MEERHRHAPVGHTALRVLLRRSQKSLLGQFIGHVVHERDAALEIGRCARRARRREMHRPELGGRGTVAAVIVSFFAARRGRGQQHGHH